MTTPQLAIDWSRETDERDFILREHVEGRNGPLLAYLRDQIRARWRGQWVTADHGRKIMREQGIVLQNNNCLGALFRSPDWVTDGVRVPSITSGSHGNPNYRWQHREDERMAL